MNPVYIKNYQHLDLQDILLKPSCTQTDESGKRIQVNFQVKLLLNSLLSLRFCEIYAVCENWLEHIILENISGSANLIP